MATQGSIRANPLEKRLASLEMDRESARSMVRQLNATCQRGVARQAALLRVRDQVGKMQDAADIGRVLEALAAVA